MFSREVMFEYCTLKILAYRGKIPRILEKHFGVVQNNGIDHLDPILNSFDLALEQLLLA